MRGTEGGGPGGPPPSPRSGQTASRVTPALGPWIDKFRHPAVALAGFTLALAAALALALGDEDAGEPGTVPLPEVAGTFVDQKIGVTVRFPHGWRADRKSGTVRVRRGDRTAVVSVASPARADKADEVLAASVGEVRSRYGRVEPLGRQELAIGGRPAQARTFLARNQDGTRLRVLLAAAEGERRTYLVNAFSADDADPRLLEIEQILSSLRLGR